MESGKSEAREKIYSKGQSKRIWNELYKVERDELLLFAVLMEMHNMGSALSALSLN